MSSPPSGPAVPRTGGPFLVVPSVEKGRGGGHLSRCAALVREARALGREAFLFPCGPYMPPAPAPAPWTGTVPLLAGLDPSWITPKPAERTWNFIVLDRFQTPPGEYRFWSSLGPLIGVDEGGPCRDRFDFLLDLLPGPPDRSLPNILDPGLLPLPLKRRSAGDSKAAGPLRVLISFGAEDHARLGQSCAAALLASSSRFNIPAWLNLCIWAHPAPAPDRAIRSNKKTICLRGGLSPAGDKVPAGVNRESAGEFFCSASIPCAGKRCAFARIRSPDGKTAADAAVPRREIGPCFHKPRDAGGESGLHITLVDPGGTWAGGGKDPEKFRVLRKIPSLGEHLAEYDLLITHFGLSAFEALYAGIPVILVSPGPYHQRLAKAAGFVSAGIGAAAAKRLGRFLSRDLGDLREHCRSLARRHGLDGEEERGRFADLIVSFRPQFLTRR
ncbi:MAG: hypothetical protein LBG07_01800, partial [Treponema sp.]|nr:hypothetical protein [Treponema sp.]